MKTGLVGFLLLGVLLAGGLLLFSRARTAPVADAHAAPAATAPAAAPAAPVELARGEDTAARIATAPPPAPEPEPKAAELQGPPREEEKVADVSLLRDLAQPPPQVISVDGHRAQFADLDARYGKMTPVELRQTFTTLESQLASGTTGEGGKSDALSVEQADELRREIAYLKELVFP